MNDLCRTIRPQIANMADGAADPAVAEHVRSCVGCSRLYRQTAQLLQAARGAWESPSVGAVSRVLGLMPESRRVLVGRRIQFGRPVHARGVVEEFQVVVGAEDVSVRILATPAQDGWTIMGRLPADDWVAEGNYPVSISEDRFEMLVPNLDESGFELIGPDDVLRIPALSDLDSDES